MINIKNNLLCILRKWICPKAYSIQQAELQKNLIESLGMPKDDLDCVYYHYCLLKSNMARLPWLFTVVYAFFYTFLWLVRFSLKKKAHFMPLRPVDAVLLLDDIDRWEDLLPPELIARYGNPTVVHLSDAISCGFLTNEELKLIWQCFIRHPFCFKLLYQVITRLGAYRKLLSLYAPSAIIIFATEDNCAMSLLTYWCEKHNVKHIDFMHGEVLLGYLFAYSRYSEIYVWGEMYKKLLQKANVSADIWHSYLPKKFICRKNAKQICNTMRIIYYLSGETKESCLRLSGALQKLRRKGYHCAVRFHPRFSDIRQIYAIFRDFEIEDPEKVSITDSLASAKFVVSTYSTVFLQAYHAGIPIVIDDVSSPSVFAFLTHINYWALEYQASTLSELCEG